jgi:hypothetical protein
VEPRPPGDGTTPGIHCRRQRQHEEILRLLSAQELHRAADLAHEHLAELPDDHVRLSVIAALDASEDPDLRRRASEFLAP